MVRERRSASRKGGERVAVPRDDSAARHIKHSGLRREAARTDQTCMAPYSSIFLSGGRPGDEIRGRGRGRRKTWRGGQTMRGKGEGGGKCGALFEWCSLAVLLSRTVVHQGAEVSGSVG